ncbi:type IX secretion system sortase PorU [Carboxylicivirga taeanensis]|uniref:type IX secretion system sortase PorU n=1 Tax=Carboxylicivirga taeanensis TaxID=1416875 RepID=UPI003F6E0627
MRKILVVLILLSATLVKAQVYTGELHFSWDDVRGDQEQYFVSFKEANAWHEPTQLPVKNVEIALPAYVHPDSIDVNLSFEASVISDTVWVDRLKGVDKEQLNLVSKRLVCQRGDYFIQLSFLPIIFDDVEQAYLSLESLQYELTIPETVMDSQLKTTGAAVNSILSNGRWVKVKVQQTGIHKISYSQLSAWGFSNPSKVNVFGNGGQMLPKSNSKFRYNDLTENAVLHEDNAIYFFAQGPIAWTYNESTKLFEHQMHDFTDVAYYFLTDEHGSGRRISPSLEVADNFTQETDEYDSYQFYELENQNLLKSGAEWYGLRYDPGQERNYSFNFEHLVKTKDIKIKTDVIARSDKSSQFSVSVGEQVIQSIGISVVDYSRVEGAFASSGSRVSSFRVSDNIVDVKLRYESESSIASGWLNYLLINAKESLQVDEQLMFRNADLVGDLAATRFYLGGINASMVLWDITDYVSPQSIAIEQYGDRDGFTYKTEQLREFVVFDKSAALPQPEFEETVANQNIKGMSVPDMLIVAHPLFESEAERLAELHARHSGLQCEVVFPYQIYNEFSSGSPDVSAIRDFAKYLYERSGKFKYLLLFGDGSFDNRSYTDANTNYILTYQSENSINVQFSYVSDDFFGCLDNGEGENILFDKLDIGIGRFPVGSTEEAKILVDRVDHYLNSSEPGAWKTEITFVGDDGDDNTHMIQAEQLSQQVYTNYPAFNHKKIFFDAYPQVTTSSGDRYPEVNEGIKEAIEGGCLIFNYTGHGNERNLAHENVLDITTIKQFTNIDRLPIFMTATCEFSRYDDYHNTSAGEWVVLSPLGGGVALFTTTRIAWSNGNMRLNESFYKHIFRKNENGSKLRLGEVIMKTKNELVGSTNRLNFTLLGDPALQLVYPDREIQTQSINGKVKPQERDTLKALTMATITGEHTHSPDAKSLVTMQVFDKPIKVKTLGNKGNVPFEYQVYQNRIYNGRIDAEGAVFQSSFIIPKDIRYNIGKGRISYYSFDENGTEAFGADNTVIIGGVSDNPPDDSQGPEIQLWLNDPSFQSGDVTGTRPLLFARFSDASGINTSGVGIGHDITLVLDGNKSLPINLNNYYATDKNSFTSGGLSYQLPPLEEGLHSLELRAWDNVNNSSLASLNFEVQQGGTLHLDNVSVYPNPLPEGGTLYVRFNHDAPNMLLDVVCSIYSIGGRLIERYETKQPAEAISVKPIEWQPGFLSRGLYILQCEISSSDNKTGKFSKKILVVK